VDQYFILPGHRATASGQFVLNFGFGAAARPQILELAGAEMIWYGTSRTLAEMPRTSFQYDGRAVDAAWRADAARRIEQYRKPTTCAYNAAGLPVPDAQVRIRCAAMRLSSAARGTPSASSIRPPPTIRPTGRSCLSSSTAAAPATT
jgi:hypothetical protein